MKRVLFFFSLLLAGAASLDAACLNKFVARQDGPGRQVVTLLTGTLTFDEASALASAIKSKSAPGIEWLDANGKVITRQLGDLKVVRPMPTACEGKPSGVVLSVTFLSVVNPTGTMRLKLTDGVIVAFEQQG